MFMRSLHTRFVRRLYLEHLPKGASADVDMEDADEDEAPEDGGLPMADLDKPDLDVDDVEDMEGAGLCLSRRTQRRVCCMSHYSLARPNMQKWHHVWPDPPLMCEGYGPMPCGLGRLCPARFST